MKNMTVCNLFIKERRGEPLVAVDHLSLDRSGIVGGVRALATRHVLIIPLESLEAFNISPGELRENVVTSGFDIHEFPSGTVLQLGTSQIRLTYHCEPCRRVAHVVNPNAIVHRRGYLGTVVKPGKVGVGDEVTSLGTRYEPIPYDIKKRIKWFLDKEKAEISLKELAEGVGLSQSYLRAIPNMLKQMDEKYKMMVNYPSRDKDPRRPLYRG